MSVVVDGDTLAFDSVAYSAQKHVLTEDYTGHLCGTCPARITVNDRSEITIRRTTGCHRVFDAGNFADVCPTARLPSAAPSWVFTMDFRCSVGNAWNTKFGIQLIQSVWLIVLAIHRRIKSVPLEEHHSVGTCGCAFWKWESNHRMMQHHRKVRAAIQGTCSFSPQHGVLRWQMVIVEGQHRWLATVVCSQPAVGAWLSIMMCCVSHQWWFRWFTFSLHHHCIRNKIHQKAGYNTLGCCMECTQTPVVRFY